VNGRVFCAVKFVSQKKYKEILEHYGNTEEESKLLSKNTWGVYHQGEIFINPVKEDGKSIFQDSQVVVHEVLHAVANFTDKDNRIIRNGLYSNEDSRELGEVIIEELAFKALSHFGDLPPERHDLFNLLCQLASFKEWVLACFTEQGYRDLQEKINFKFGPQGFEIVALLIKYSKFFEFSKYLETGTLVFNTNTDQTILDKFRALGVLK
jgi:hypothetical protein